MRACNNGARNDRRQNQLSAVDRELHVEGQLTLLQEGPCHLIAGADFRRRSTGGTGTPDALNREPGFDSAVFKACRLAAEIDEGRGYPALF